jgi:penicillin-binding protein 1A
MASSGDYAASKFNLAAQGRRQPGSTFKVMVMMAALRQGVDINKTTYVSKPLNFIDKKTGAKIDVQTDDHAYGGSTSIFNGLVKSDNTVFQQLDLDVGPEEVRKTAYDMGITSQLDAYPAEGLGGLRIGVSPLEMTRAYATINSGGWRVSPVAITKVEFPGGRVDSSLGRRKRVKIFTDGQTHEATLAMEANIQRGTGTAAQLGCPAAGKTGTTSSFTDAWFDGFTTSLNTAVWVGYPNSTQSMLAVPGYGEMFGGRAPALIWHDFMSTAMEGRACDAFPEPTEPFSSAPFFGEYASTGAPGGGKDAFAKDQNTTGSDKAKDKTKQDKKFPPSQYESPPQPAPKPDGGGDQQQSAPVSPTGGVGVG